MERLLLLWDELDELVCYGRQLALGLSHAVLPKARRDSRVARPLN